MSAQLTTNHAKIINELWQAAVNLRGSIEPADYKRYVLTIIFLRFLSLGYERRCEALQALTDDPESEYHTTAPEVAESILENETFLTRHNFSRV